MPHSGNERIPKNIKKPRLLNVQCTEKWFRFKNKSTKTARSKTKQSLSKKEQVNIRPVKHKYYRNDKRLNRNISRPRINITKANQMIMAHLYSYRRAKREYSNISTDKGECASTNQKNVSCSVTQA